MALKKPEGYGRVAFSSAKILQLIPAHPDWWLRYRDNTPDGEWTAPIVAWALAETEEGWQRIYGVDPSGDDFHLYGDHITEVTYFYSPEPPPSAHGVGDPGPTAKKT